MPPHRIRIPTSSARPVAAGHPWVYRDPLVRVETGAVVELCDERGRPIAWGLGDRGEIAVRVLGTGGAPSGGLRELWRRRVAAADALRTGLVPAETDAMRVVNGAGDGLPGVVIDRYASLAVLRLYSSAWVPHLEDLVAATAALPWVGSVLRRYGVDRVDGREGAEILAGPEAPEVIVVREAGMRMLVRPFVGQKTGLFLDQREHRAWVRRLAAGRQVANLFGYNGGFSVAAALGGAAGVVTVDLAAAAVDDARENFRLNGLDPARYGFEVADAFTWRPREPVGLLILDPPALSRGRRSDGAARAAYRKLHRHHAPGVGRGGLLATSSCSARLSGIAWRRAVSEGLGGPGWSWLWTSAQPPDHPVALGHPEGEYLKFAIVVRRAS